MDSSNLFAVRVTKAGIVSDWAGVPLSRDEALNLAAWLIGIAEPMDALLLGDSVTTATGRLLREIVKQDSAIAD